MLFRRRKFPPLICLPLLRPSDIDRACSSLAEVVKHARSGPRYVLRSSIAPHHISFSVGFVKRSLSRLRNLYEICPRDSALESPSLPVAPVVPPSLRHPPMLLIFLCALGISFSFMATRAVPDSPPIPVGRRRSSPSRLLIHAEWGDLPRDLFGDV